MHSLENDLESFIYIILYAALRWLPVASPPATLDWWITVFFGAPDHDGFGGGVDAKLADTLTRKYTEDLNSTGSSHVVDWIKDAMDLHFGKCVQGMAANPLRDDGKALRAMWEESLAKNLPSNDRCVNPIPYMKIPEGSLHATYTATTSTQNLYRYRNNPIEPPPPLATSLSPPPPPAKKPRTHAPQPLKLPQKGHRPQTRSMTVESRERPHRDEDLMTGVESATTSSGASPEGSIHTST